MRMNECISCVLACFIEHQSETYHFGMMGNIRTILINVCKMQFVNIEQRCAPFYALVGYQAKCF